jgi:hypothetical protein
VAPFEFRKAGVRSAAVQAEPEIPAPPELDVVVGVVEVVLVVVAVEVEVVVLCAEAAPVVWPVADPEDLWWDTLAVLDPPQPARRRAAAAISPVAA